MTLLEAVTADVKTSAAPVSRRIALTVFNDPEQISIAGVHELVKRISADLILWFGQGGRRSHVGNQGGFHIIYRFAVGGIFAISAKDRDHHWLQTQCRAIRQPIFIPPFLRLEHFDFTRAARGVCPDCRSPLSPSFSRRPTARPATHWGHVVEHGLTAANRLGAGGITR